MLKFKVVEAVALVADCINIGNVVPGESNDALEYKYEEYYGDKVLPFVIPVKSFN